MNDIIKVQITSTEEALCKKVKEMLTPYEFELSSCDVKGDQMLDAAVTVLYLSDIADVDDALINLGTLSSKLIVLSDICSTNLKEWAFQNKAAEYFCMPVSAGIIAEKIEELARNTDFLSMEDDDIISFLRLLKEKGNRFQPVLNQTERLRHSYQELHSIPGFPYDQISFLEYLAGRGFLKKELFNRVRMCPNCPSDHLNYRELCPRCDSINIHQKQAVHHFSCGYVAPLDEFNSSGSLICPKCSKDLKHIGSDYEKMADYFSCSSCDFICPEPAVKFQCIKCGSTGDPHDTLEENIYTYTFSNIAEEAIVSGKLNTLDLKSIIVNKSTGLYNKEYLVHELQHGVERYQRYQLPFTFMLVRIDNYEDVKRNFPNKLDMYVDTIFACLSKYLRTLDTICVWESNMLALVCGGTDAAGTAILAERMHESALALDHLYEFAKPELTICLNECSDKIKDYNDLVDDTLKDFDD